MLFCQPIPSDRVIRYPTVSQVSCHDPPEEYAAGLVSRGASAYRLIRGTPSDRVVRGQPEGPDWRIWVGPQEGVKRLSAFLPRHLARDRILG